MEDGKLSMGEVQSLELRARLVVLSECDSFRGKLSSDGVIGIPRAFVAAGAPTLVASLWKVDDAATKELMRRFYARLLEGGAVGDADQMTAAMLSVEYGSAAAAGASESYGSTLPLAAVPLAVVPSAAVPS